MEKIELSIIVPAYNEADNLPLLFDAIKTAFATYPVEWEMVIIDDHSTDETYSAIQSIVENDPRVRGFRLSRNYGSHLAILCGLEHAVGACGVVLAADMQDPPAVIPKLMEQWKNGDHIVWAVRSSREGERKSIGMKEIPASGSDYFLLDRRVINTILQFNEKNVSILALLSWLGFRQSFIYYDKKERTYGRSGWNLEKKIKLVLDSFTSFSYLPIRLISYLGIIVALLGFLYAGIVIINAIFGPPPQGWSSLMVVMLVVGGIQMMMMGILGEYLWRALDESRRRPLYTIEDDTQSQNQ
jgi:dolichol-phosphate mannosyltransferase